MKYHQIVHQGGNLIAANHVDSNKIINYEDLVPVESPKEFFSQVQDVYTELTELVNKSFPVVEQDGIIANAFLDTYFGETFRGKFDDVNGDDIGSVRAIQFYYVPAIDKK
ncbi:hypothetical protein KY333_01790 [Candidatus Woesearchaeota archaeon]|nr:hypothetical protein [Candidatus Woesearchaeota archaeon]